MQKAKHLTFYFFPQEKRKQLLKWRVPDWAGPYEYKRNRDANKPAGGKDGKYTLKCALRQ